MALNLPGGYRLILAGGRLGWFWGLAGIVAVVLLIVLYREERRLVSRRTGLFLLACRLLAALVLVSSLFEPIAARTLKETRRGRWIVGVDVSESMTATDPNRPDDQRARLLKILDRPDEPTRLEIAHGLLAGPNSPIRKLAAEHDLEVITFAKAGAVGTLDGVAETLKSLSKTVRAPGVNSPRVVEPSRLETDWLPVLSAALKSNDESPTLGVVLLTDGRRNGKADANGVVERLGSRALPVYSVMIGTSQPPKDAAVISAKGPDTVYQGDVATVEAVLKLDGYEGRVVTVKLERPGAEPMVERVRAGAAGVRPSLAFRVPMETLGTFPLSVAIEPQEGDSRPGNDRRSLMVRVTDDKAKVLLVDGEARWEFQYLRNAFARDPRIALETTVFQQPGLGRAPSASEMPTYALKLPEIPPGDTDNDPLAGFDAVMIGDVDPVDLPNETWERLDRFVSARGGTLILNPGPRHWSSLTANPSARKLMPMLDPAPLPLPASVPSEDSSPLPPGRSFDPDPVAGADFATWPMLQLAANADDSRKRWQLLPKLPWSIGGRQKPGASALAGSGGDPSSVVMASHPYGLGKVLWVGTDATWRWRFRLGDAYHHRFWGQVVRWAASGKLGAGNALVRFGPLKPQVDEASAVRIQARIAETVTNVDSHTLLAARIFRVDSKGAEAVAVVPLRPLAGQPRTFDGIAPLLPVGSYKVRLDAPGLALNLDREGTNPLEAPLEVTPREGTETIELAADRDALEQLAKATQGKVIQDADANELPSLLKALAQTRVTTKTTETTLWDTPGALLLFLIVMTVEWVTRKRAGLP